MSAIISTINSLQNILAKFRTFDFLGSLTLRLYLAPIFIAVEVHKYMNIDVANWQS